MSLTKTKTKTKTYTKSFATFPANGWQYDMEYVIELPNFFENPAWGEVPIDPPPGPDKTAEELAELLQKQEQLEKNYDEWQRLKQEVKEDDDDSDSPRIRRLLMLGSAGAPGGAYPGTYVLMQAMIVLGKVVAVHFKNRFMRARPSQIEPRLRPLIDVPGHPAYPSGHAVQMFLVAKALSTVVRSHEVGEELFKLAERIARNRELAGLHYASDTDAGKRLAFTIFPLVEDAYRESFQKAAREWL